MSEHTPGPWTVWPHLVGDGYHHVGPTGGSLVALLPHIEWGQPGRPIDEQEANACLIAAAPDLLAALMAVEWAGRAGSNVAMCPLCRGLEDWTHESDCLIGKAIKKVEGLDNPPDGA